MTRLEYLLASIALRVLGAAFSLLPIRRDRVTLATARVPHLDGNLLLVSGGAPESMLAASPEDLAPFVQMEKRCVPPKVWDERVFLLGWKEAPDEWALAEDSPTTERKEGVELPAQEV